jgi:hypothetical protein
MWYGLHNAALTTVTSAIVATVAPTPTVRDCTPTKDEDVRRPSVANADSQFLLPVIRASYETWFRSLADRWRRETAHLSSLSTRRQHPAYRRIVEMKEAAVPYILGELEHRPDFWFAALRSATKVDPVPRHSIGKFDEMRHAWLSWARENDITPKDARYTLPTSTSV